MSLQSQEMGLIPGPAVDHNCSSYLLPSLGIPYAVECTPKKKKKKNLHKTAILMLQGVKKNLSAIPERNTIPTGMRIQEMGKDID